MVKLLDFWYLMNDNEVNLRVINNRTGEVLTENYSQIDYSYFDNYEVINVYKYCELANSKTVLNVIVKEKKRR